MKHMCHLIIGAITVITLLINTGPSHATDIEVNPGYINGCVILGDYTVYNISTNAEGGGYRSSKTTNNNSNYQMTVQGGDWDYNVTASASVHGENSNTSLGFNSRIFSVDPGENITNNYIYDVGTIRFIVTITGDRYLYWRGTSNAQKEMNAGNEKTYSQSSTNPTSLFNNATWEMPVVANQQISVNATIQIFDPVYSYRTYTFDFGKKDVAPGQIIQIPINIEYEQTPPRANYGEVEGTISLNNLAPQDFLIHHSYYIGNVFENPGSYHTQIFLNDATKNTLLFTLATSFPGGDFRWPYIDGNPTNNYVEVEAGQTTEKNFSLDSGVITGKTNLSGTVKTEDLSRIQVNIYGINRYYTPGVGWATTSTNYGFARYTNTIPYITDEYRAILSPGQWQPYIINAYKSHTIYGNSSTSIYDYNNYYDGSYYDFGNPVEISAGETTKIDFDYCVGSIFFRFHDASGGFLKNASVVGSGIAYNDANKREMLIGNNGQNNLKKVATPEVELFGPTANYTFHTIQVYVQDGTLIKFPPLQHKIQCNVTNYFDIPGPDLVVTEPVNELITNANSIEVQGTATGLAQITGLTINEQEAPFYSTGNPDDELEITFNHDLTLDDGVNTIMTTVTDAMDARASDKRIVYVDRWQPEVSIEQPTNGQLIWYEDVVSAVVEASDRGYGYALSVYLDDQLISQLDGEADDTTATMVNFIRNLGVLPIGNHTISAEVVDLAGNSASSTTTFTVFNDIWDPTVEIVRPSDGAFFAAGADEIPLEVVAADQGGGFDLMVFLDGNVIHTANGPRSLNEPVAITFNDMIEPLSIGSHTIRAVVNDLAGHSATAETTINAYQQADIVVKPESRNNNTNGVLTIFVRLPNDLTANASTTTSDNVEISAEPDQYPTSVRYSEEANKLVLKFKRNPEIMADQIFTVQGRYTSSAGVAGEWYYWQGSDTTKK